ncbi:MAG: choice-of-anchor D domain-containing protein, partial [Chloroflexi bacterium]|nr:choice-of-anchor D domain-containing protein [Chloroflexota bacterium]
MSRTLALALALVTLMLGASTPGLALATPDAPVDLAPTIMYLQAPDLVITAITPAVSCVTDGTLSGSIVVQVRNQGDGSAGAFTVQVTDGQGWTGTGTCGGLAADASADVVIDTATWNPACNFCTAYSLNAIADLADAVTESDETNNTYGPVSCTPPVPDLTVNSVTPAVMCVSDGNLQGSVTVNVSNIGCAAANGVVVRLTSDCGIVFTDQTVNLAAGASTDLVFNFTPDCAACTCTFIADIDPDNTICECAGYNNVTFGAPYTMNVPDIVVDNDTLGVSCSADGQVTASGTVTLRNDGCGPNLTANVPMRFTLYDNTGCSGNTVAQWTQPFTGVSIPAGGGSQIFAITPQTFSANLCTNSTGCQVSIRVEADYTGAICECSGTNNTRCTDRTVDIPDLVVTDIDFTNVTCTSDSLGGSVRVTIQNNGCATASNFPVALATDGCLSFSNQTVASLAAGASTTVIFAISGSWNDCSDCSCQFTATVDPTNVVCECDGTNNQRTETYTSNRPDLQVNSATPAVTSGGGDLQGTVTVNVSNDGCAAANGVVVRLTSDCGIVFTDQTVNLAVGGNANLVFNFTPDCANCTCRFTATIDPGDAICECDGTNNALSSAPYDLAPEMRVEGNGIEIGSGDTTPSLADHTNFGGVDVVGQTVVRTFSIRNTGTAYLDLSGSPRVAVVGPHAAEFMVTAPPASPVAVSTTFQVTFDPAAPGLRSATLRIANDDADENPYEFAIQGTGTTADLAITKQVGPPVAASGQTITYTLVYSNAGPGTATGVVITDVVPVTLTNVSYASSGATITPTGSISYTWQVADLAPGAGGVITITGVISPGLGSTTTFTNTATIAAWQVDPTPGNASSSAGVRVCGSCLATPDDGATVYSTVQAAVDAAPTGGTVKVAGTCVGVEMRAGVTQTVYISKTLTVRGGYINTNWTTSNPAAYPTTLDALGQGRVAYLAGGSVTLESLRLTGGHAAAGGGNYGGGVYVGSGSATLSGGQIISNTADYGGGVYVETGSVTLSGQARVISNTAEYGGGVFVEWGSATLSGAQTQVVSNTAQVSGGGVYLSSGSVTLSGAQAEIRGNTATYGGGVYVDSTTAVFTQTGASTISFNSASDHGGGVYVGSGNATLSDAQAQVISNSASYGGGVFVASGSATLSGGQVISNAATWYGGGVYVGWGQATLSAGEIRGNTASRGGGVCLQYTGSVFTQTGASTIRFNSASSYGGGVYVESGSATLSGGQVAGNTAQSTGGGVYVGWGQATLSGGQIISNTAVGGGGVYVFSGSATLSGAQIVSNTALWGGGMDILLGSATLSAGEIRGNTALDRGGGVMLESAPAAFTQTGASIISFNSAGDLGGGVYVGADGRFTFSGAQAQITSNTADYGGGVYVSVGSATLSGGRIISNTAVGGGGVYIRSGTATLSGGQVISNTAEYGGGVYVGYAGAVFTQTGVSTITLNAAAYAGGGVYVATGRAALSGGQVISNTAEYGGGVFVSSGRATLSGGRIIGNTAGDEGGGVYVSLPGAAFTQTGASTITLNSAIRGGGMYVDWGQATVKGAQAQIRDNSALSGGGVFVNWGSMTVSDGQIVSNTASQGGGISVDDGPVTVSGAQAQVSYNTATYGGGVYVLRSSDTTLTDATVSHNGGGGVYVDGGTVRLFTTTVKANDVGIVVGDGAAGSLVAHHSVISGNTTAGLTYVGVTPTDIDVTLGGAPGLTNAFGNNGPGGMLNVDVSAPSTRQPIHAFYNDWGVVGLAAIESTLYHQLDNPARARVEYYTLTLSTAPATQVADGVASVDLTATLTGVLDLPVGEVISFTTSLGTLSAPAAPTDASHQAGVSATSTAAGTAWVSATTAADPQWVWPAATTVLWQGCDVGIQKSVAPAVTGPGHAIIYTLVYSNTGPMVATGVLIIDVVPVGQIGNLSYASSGAAIAPVGTVSYTWQVANLTPGAGGVITITGVIRPGLSGVFSLTNQVAITSSVADTNPANDTSTAANTIDAEPPAPPTLVSPANDATTGDNTPTLTWNISPSPDAAGYQVDFAGTVMNVGNVTTYNPGLLADGVYTWTVAAYDAVGNAGAYATVWSFTVDTTSPVPPTLVSPANGATTADDTPTLTWNISPSPDVAGYQVDFAGTVTDVGNVTTHNPGLLADGVYTWTVAAYDAVGNVGAYAAVWSFTVDTTAPAPPTLVSPANGATTGDDTPTLTWTASPSPDAAGYRVDFDGTVTDVGNVTTHNPGLLADGVYTWTVAAYDAVGNVGAYAAVWSFTV